MMVVVQPAGKLENFYVIMSTSDHGPSPKEITRIFLENEMRVDRPPLKIGKKKNRAKLGVFYDLLYP